MGHFSIEVRILNWEKFNPRNDVKNSSWFRFQHDFIDDWKFFDFTHGEIVFWVYILCLASKRNENGKITVNTEHAHRVQKLDITACKSAIEKLKRNQVIEVRTLRGRYADVSDAYATRRDVTERNEKKDNPPTPQGKESAIADAEVDADGLVFLWNENRGGLPACRGLNSNRRKSARARLSENSSRAYWLEVIRRLAGSKFCNGGGAKGWRADFDFLIRPDTHLRTLEGKYDDAGEKKNTNKYDEEIIREIQERVKNAENARRKIAVAPARVDSTGVGDSSAGDDRGALAAGGDRGNVLAVVHRADGRAQDA